MNLWVRTFHLLGIGLVAGMVLGFSRGLPTAQPIASDDATCTAPVPTQPLIQWIKVTEAETLLGNPEVRFVDARSSQAYQSGHVANALHLPLTNGTIEGGSLYKLAGVKTIIVYCDTDGGCNASKRVAGLLSTAGFPDVRVLEGGIKEWLAQNYPAEAGACLDCP